MSNTRPSPLSLTPTRAQRRLAHTQALCERTRRAHAPDLTIQALASLLTTTDTPAEIARRLDLPIDLITSTYDQALAAGIQFSHRDQKHARRPATRAA